jgi:hypothetical protein
MQNRVEKIILLSNNNANIRPFLRQLENKTFFPSLSVIGIDFISATIAGITYQLWDAAGLMEFTGLLKGYFNYASSAICFNLTDDQINKYKSLAPKDFLFVKYDPNMTAEKNILCTIVDEMLVKDVNTKSALLYTATQSPDSQFQTIPTELSHLIAQTYFDVAFKDQRPSFNFFRSAENLKNIKLNGAESKTLRR